MNEYQRQQDRRAGLIRITLKVDRLWAAEALAQAGYGHGDGDSREEVQARAQEL
jgi:hypothetical protein